MSQKANFHLEKLTDKWSRWTDYQDIMIQHNKHDRIENQKRNLQHYPRQGKKGFAEKVTFEVSPDR